MLLKKCVLNLGLPPEAILTRWFIWLEAAIYYEKYFNEVKVVINAFDQNNVKCIESRRNLFHKK